MQVAAGTAFESHLSHCRSCMEPITCLLIDDDFEEAEIFQYAIQELNLPVNFFTCSSGYEALRKLSRKEIRPDVIFLDFCMPRMDGRDCLQHLREIKSLKSVKIIIYSTYMREPLQAELEKLGANGFLHKSSDISDLVEKLRNAFSATKGKRKRHAALEAVVKSGNQALA